MAVLTPDDARDAMGIPNLPPELVSWINYMVNQSEVLADTLTEEIYQQTKASVEQPRDPAALKAAEKMWHDDARKRAETLATNMSTAQLKQIGQTIADGLEAGLGPREIARNLDAVKGLDANRAKQYTDFVKYLDSEDLTSEEIERKAEAYFQKLLRERKETIARTEAREATSEAALSKNRDRGARFKVWITAGDDRVSDECQGNEAEGPIPIDDDFSSGDDRPPQHPNCLVPETPVFAPDKRAAFIAAYSGPVVEIVLTEGGSVTVTPNHMFLTPCGFAAAKSLREGDEIFNCPIVERVVMRDPQNHGLPTRIDEVVGALTKTRGVSREAVPLSAEYLHGDARFAHGHIDVIATDSFLRHDINSTRAQTIGEIDLGIADTELLGLARCRNLLSMLFAMRDATDGGMGIRRESETFLRRHAREAQFVGVASGSNLYTSPLQPSHYSGARNTNILAQRKHRFASGVSRDEHGIINTVEVSNAINSVASKRVVNERHGHIVYLRNFLQRFTGLVSLANVRHTRVINFTGHVYDLQTESSLYVAGGLISSNCRCTLSYVTSDEQLERAETRASDRAEKTAAAKQGGE